MGDSEMVGAVAVPLAQADDHTPTKKKHHHKEKRKEAKHDADLNVDDDNEEQDRRHRQNNEGGEQQQQLATKKDKKKKKLHSKAREEEEEEEESVQKEKDGDVSEDEEEEDDDRVEEEVVVPAEEQRTTAATERKRRGTVSLYDMVAAEGNTIRRDATAAEKNESDEEEAEAEAEDEEHGGSGKKAERTRASAATAKNEDDSSDSEENEGSGLKSEGAKKVESGNAAKGGSANKERELALKAQKEKEREERERERKKEKELMREKKEKERKEREEKEREERERREKEKLKEKERKREEKEKKKKEKLGKKAAAKEKLKETKDAHNSGGGVEDLSTTSASATAGGASAAVPRDHGPAPVSALPLEGRRSSGHEDEAQALAVDDDDSEDPAAADDYAGPGSPQARYKEMMAQKYASVSSDPNGYRAHMTTSYFSKLAEQRRIKRSREEALKKIKHLNPRDYQAVKKAHERLLKEAREARRRRVKEGGSVAGKGRSGGLHLVMSDLGPAAHAGDEAAKVAPATAETDGGEMREKAASAKILAAAGRRSKFTKKYANSMPDMDRKAIRAGLKEDREEEAKAKTKAKSDRKKNGEEEEKAEDEDDEEEAAGEGDDEEDEDADEPHEGKAARLLNSSKSAPKAPLSPKSRKSTPDKDGAVPIDPEEFFDELYAICSEEEPLDEVEKYLFVGRLLRDHELHKQEREQRLKRMIGLQTSENGSTLWKESEDIFHKPLSSFVCHRDFARLVRKYQIERPAGEILCGPFDNAEMPKTEATYTVLVTLAMALDDTTLSENIQTNFKRGEYFKTDDDLSDPTGLKVFFDEVIGEHTPLMRILKVTSQSIVAPCITKLKACMAPLDFNSVRNSWSIAIAVDNEEVTIVHTKKETATPDSEEKYGPFTFEWAIEYVFDLEMTSLKYLRPMLMNVRGSKKSRKVLKKAYTQLVSVKASK